jgi:5-methylcytosine-specific restriction endonuclease McrA
MNYKKYLGSEHWQKVRKHHYQKQSRRACYLCGSRDNLNIHHLTYRDSNDISFLGRENSSILRTLCGDCHQLWHKYLPLTGSTKYQYRVINLISKGINKEVAFREAPNTKSYRRLFKAPRVGGIPSFS